MRVNGGLGNNEEVLKIILEYMKTVESGEVAYFEVEYETSENIMDNYCVILTALLDEDFGMDLKPLPTPPTGENSRSFSVVVFKGTREYPEKTVKMSLFNKNAEKQSGETPSGKTSWDNIKVGDVLVYLDADDGTLTGLVVDVGSDGLIRVINGREVRLVHEDNYISHHVKTESSFKMAFEWRSVNYANKKMQLTDLLDN